MNGASGLPCVNKTSRPSSSKIVTIGNIHHFFSWLRNWKYSLMICSFRTAQLLFNPIAIGPRSSLTPWHHEHAAL
jgi:hypothetical protein